MHALSMESMTPKCFTCNSLAIWCCMCNVHRCGALSLVAYSSCVMHFIRGSDKKNAVQTERQIYAGKREKKMEMTKREDIGCRWEDTKGSKMENKSKYFHLMFEIKYKWMLSIISMANYLQWQVKHASVAGESHSNTGGDCDQWTLKVNAYYGHHLLLCYDTLFNGKQLNLVVLPWAIVQTAPTTNDLSATTTKNAEKKNQWEMRLFSKANRKQQTQHIQ